MFKRFFIVIVAAAVLLTAVPALAATPSKTTDDMTRITKLQSEDGSAGDALIYVRPEPSDFADKTLSEITAYNAKNKLITGFFSEEVKVKALEFLPKDTDLNKMTMSEFVSIGIGEYKAEFGDVTATFQFPLEFKDKQLAVAVLGYTDAQGNTVWAPLKTEVVDGTLVILFPSEILLVAGHDAVLAVLSN